MVKHVMYFMVFLVILIGAAMFNFRMLIVVEASISSLEVFLTDPSQSSWQTFEADVRSGYYGQSGNLFKRLLEYHEARLKRDFPSSMALAGITPNDFVKLQSDRADSALVGIRVKESEIFWRLLGKMAIQTFDEDFVWTACEIAARLSPPRFEVIATDVERLHQDESWIIKRIREKWLSPR